MALGDVSQVTGEFFRDVRADVGVGTARDGQPVNKFSATKLRAALQTLDASALVSVMPTSVGTGSTIGCVVPIHERYFTGRGCSSLTVSR